MHIPVGLSIDYGLHVFQLCTLKPLGHNWGLTLFWIRMTRNLCQNVPEQQ